MPGSVRSRVALAAVIVGMTSFLPLAEGAAISLEWAYELYGTRQIYSGGGYSLDGAGSGQMFKLDRIEVFIQDKGNPSNSYNSKLTSTSGGSWFNTSMAIMIDGTYNVRAFLYFDVYDSQGKMIADDNERLSGQGNRIKTAAYSSRGA